MEIPKKQSPQNCVVYSYSYRPINFFIWVKTPLLHTLSDGKEDERVVKFVCADVDTGGGARLSNLEPKLKENGTMPEHGRGSNCQYHGQNKPYENASTAAFGSQGLEKANVFQAGYQYSVLVKALKEDVGLEVSFA